MAHERSEISHQPGQQDALAFRNDLIGWAQPLIIDQINDFYFTRLHGRWNEARDLAISHFRIWRHVLHGDVDAAGQDRIILERCLVLAQLDPLLVDEADRMIFDELMDVIVTRFQRTPSLARGYGMTLLDTATSLARSRSAA